MYVFIVLAHNIFKETYIKEETRRVCSLVLTSIEGFMDVSSLKELWTKTMNTHVSFLP